MSTFKQCHVMAKPSSSVCNLDCTYCFYLEKENLYPERKSRWQMSDDTLEAYVKQYIAAHSDNESIEFSWQGGEPTLMGLDFFRKAVELQNKYKQHHRITNAFQTNGLLVDDEWCQFFKQHNFLIGISIDGPAHLHDHFRVTRAGKASHEKVMAAITKMKKHGVDFNTLTVLNSENVKYPEEVYDFLIGIGSTFLQFIPIVERTAKQETEEGLFLVSPEYQAEADVTEWSVPSLAYGEFLNRVFDRWVKKDVGRIFVNTFDSTLATWCNEPSGICVQSETCGHAFILESNGDMYNCDHFVYPEHKLGNIHSASIQDLNQTDKAVQFGMDKKDKLTLQCRRCPYRMQCHGGCPKHRFARSEAGQEGHSYFCAGYYAFFSHTGAKMKQMRDLLMRGRPASDIVYLDLQKKMVANTFTGGRNSPCPCGSGKKVKRCCQIV
ncbi:sulfatase maturase [Photobacterium gaetbulicola]|uniref:Sulfatase maturase n=1 Tax=Photobacterium gaetbulicola TaxID=1295392 RepID=A0A0B9G1A3_9GAMM|nr:anaerobic sulfatase maturase [Photobacterium gaetbulicola]KHT62503.1 sulfatase maturase [Photobacterium gaetbulicola]